MRLKVLLVFGSILVLNGDIIQKPSSFNSGDRNNFVPKYLQIFVNVKDFGVKGDGSTDDTDAIQEAINYVAQIGGGIIFFPYTKNYYKLSNSLNLYSNITLMGEKYSFIYNDTSNAVPVIKIVGTSDNRLSNITIKGLKIRNGTASTNTYTTGKDGIKIEYADNITIEDCYITEIQGAYGLRTKYATNILVRNNVFYRCTYSCFTILVECENIKVENNIFDTTTAQNTPQNYLFATGGENNNEGSYYCKNVWVINNKFLNNQRWEGIDTHGCENIWIENNYVENVKVGIMAGVALGYVSNPVLKNVYIRNNVLIQGNGESNHYGIVCQGNYNDSVYVPAENVYIENNYIKGFGASNTSTIGAITIYSVKNVVIRNNKIEDFKASGILLYHDVNNVLIENNEIKNPIAGDNAGEKVGIRFRDKGLWKVKVLNNRIYSDNVNYLFTYGIKSDSQFIHCQILWNYINNYTSVKYAGTLPVNRSATPTDLFGVQGDMATDTNDKITYACSNAVIRFSSSVSTGITVSGTAGSNQLTITSGDFRKLCEGLEIVIIGAGAGGGNLTTTIIKLTNKKIWIRDNLINSIKDAKIYYTNATWKTI